MMEFAEYKTGEEMRAAYSAIHRRLTMPKPEPKPIAAAPPRAPLLPPPLPITIPRILSAVAEAHQMGVHIMVGRSQVQPVVWARFHAAAVLRKRKPKLSFSEIGRILGGRDHSTVCNGMRTWRKIEAKIEKQISAVEAAL